LLAVEVDNAQVVWLHEALRNAGRRAEHAIFAQAETDVTVIGRGKSLVVDSTADLAHLLAKLPFIHHGSVAVHGFLFSEFPYAGSTASSSMRQAQYASTGVLFFPNGLAASRPSLTPIRLPSPAPKLS